MIVAEGANSKFKADSVLMLQWGRNLIVAEGVVVAFRALYGLPASMGPQLDSCGRKGYRHKVEIKYACFNGAAT